MTPRSTSGPLLGLSAFAVSTLLHVVALTTISHPWNFTGSPAPSPKNSKESSQIMELQFVEAPHKIHPDKPHEDAPKISNRDAVNQNPDSVEASPEEAPKTLQLGEADQLQQKRGAPVTMPMEAAPEKKLVIAEPSDSSPKQLESGVTALPKPEEAKLPELRPQDPSQARPPVAPQGLTGADNIDTQEMGRTVSKGAWLRGQTSFEATGSGMGEYMKGLKEKIWLLWFPYLMAQFPLDARGADAVISFTLDKKGDVKIVRVLESRGTPLFATYCMNTIQRAGNFGELPDELLALLGKEELEIKFGFHYR